LQVNTRIINN